MMSLFVYFVFELLVILARKLHIITSGQSVSSYNTVLPDGNESKKKVSSHVRRSFIHGVLEDLSGDLRCAGPPPEDHSSVA